MICDQHTSGVKSRCGLNPQTCPVALKRIVEDEENIAEISVLLGLWPTKLCITDVSEEVQNEDASVETGQVFWIYRASSCTRILCGVHVLR